MFADQMNGLDFFFSAPATAAVASSTATAAGDASLSAAFGRNEEDDDWGDFVDSSRAGSLPPDPDDFSADRNGTDSSEVAQPGSAPSRIESSQAQWVKPRGPVPLSVFGEAEEEEGGERDGSGASVPSFKFSFDSMSSKHNNGNGSVNKVVSTNPSVGINDLIANLYGDNGQNKQRNGLNSLPENTSGRFDLGGKNSQWNSLNLDGNVLRSGWAEVPVKVGSSDLELNDIDLSQNVPNSVVSLENLSWNPLNFDVERLEPKSDAMNSNTSEVMFNRNGSNLGSIDQNNDIDEDDGWEFKTAESKLQTGNGDSKLEEHKMAEGGPDAISNASNLSWNIWSLPSNGTGPDVSGKTVDSVFDTGNEEDDSWANDGWEFKVAEPGKPKNDITSKVEGSDMKDTKISEFAVAFGNGVHQVDLFAVSSQQSDGWGFGFDFNSTSKTETTTFPNSNSQSQQYERGTVLSFFPSDSEETTSAFKQSSSETDRQSEEKHDVPDVLPVNFQRHLSGNVVQENQVQLVKPNGPLALSLFGEDLESSDPVVNGDIPSSIHDSSSRDKPKAPGPSISITDLISSLYSQVEEKTTVNLSTNDDENREAVTDSNLVNDIDDNSWEFQGPAQSVLVSDAAKDVNDIDDDSWEFQGLRQTITESGVAEGVDEFYDGSWEFQGPTQPVTVSDVKKGDKSSWEFEGVSVGNETPSQRFAPAGTGEQPESNIEVHDCRDLFDKLKTELCYIVVNHLGNLKEARRVVADSGEGFEVEKRDEEIQDLQKKLLEDVRISEVGLESLQPRPSGISELINTFKDPKFRMLDSEYRLSERLLSAEKDWNSAIELLKHVMWTLKILNFDSSEQQSNDSSTWLAIASACVQELRHGVSIWKQAQEKNVQREILSASKGKNYILALNEVYRVAKILGASTRLYEPWILLAPGSNVLALLDECASLWSSSGLEEALLNISDLHNDNSAAQFLESLKRIDELDAFTLHSRIISASEPICRISGLTTEIIPGTRTIEWNGEHYFAALANLWANLVSRDPPSLPHTLLGNLSFSKTGAITP